MKNVVRSLSGGVDSAVPPELKLRKDKELRVVVGLSGGVDSAVSAALLQQQGYEVMGVFLECWRAPGCRVDEDRRDAMDVALKLGIPFRVLDFKKEYREKVVGYFYREYEAGRTPNPDTMCNREIKFGMFYEWAMDQGFDYVATGHYARIQGIREVPRNKYQATNKSDILNNKFQLLQGIDEKKDQSYFLYQLREEQLAHILFPIGEMTKTEVRQKAKELGLLVAEKSDSQGICFIGEVSVKQFLMELGMEEKQGTVFLKLKTRKSKLKNTYQKSKGDGEDLLEVGEHDGAWFYTVGQRHGFKIQDLRFKNTAEEELFRSLFDTSSMPPLYVLEKDVETNTLVVGVRKQVMKREFEVGEVHWINQDTKNELQETNKLQISNTNEQKTPIVSGNLHVRIRHRGELISSKLIAQNIQVRLQLDQLVFGVAAGQACVFYDDEVCLGGGIIL